MRKRPLLIASFGFTLGVLFGPAELPWVDAIAGLVCFGIARRRRFRFPIMQSVFVWTGAFLLGLPVGSFLLPAEETIRAPAVLIVEGDVVEAPDRGSIADGIVIDAVRTATAAGAPFAEARGRISVRVSAPCGASGDRVRAHVALIPRRPALIPAFRSRRLAVRRGVQLYGEARRCEVLDASGRSFLADAIRGGIARAAPDRAGLLSLLATGGRSVPASAEEARFAKAGVGHLFELSGLVIALFASLLLFALRDRPAIAAALAIPLLISLALIYGASPSVVRAVLVLLVLLLPLLRPELDSLDALAISVIVVLALSPAALGDVRFQLAFAGLSAAVRVYPELARRIPPALPRPARAPLSLLLLAIAIAIGTAPLAARAFDRVTLLSLALAPVALIAVIGLAAPLAIAGGLLSAIAPAAGAPLLHSAARLLDGVLWMLPARDFASIPTPTVFECVLFYALITAVVAKKVRGAAAIAVALIASIAFGMWKRSAGDHLEVTVLPAPSGQAYLIRFPDARVLARDTSPPTPRFQMEQRLVGNQLAIARYTAIDALIAHPRDDLSAARELAQQLPVREVWWLERPTDPAALEQDRVLDAPLEYGGARIVPTQAGLRIEMGARSVLFADTSTATADAVILPDGSVIAGDTTYRPHTHGVIRVRIEDDRTVVIPFRSVP